MNIPWTIITISQKACWFFVISRLWPERSSCKQQKAGIHQCLKIKDPPKSLRSGWLWYETSDQWFLGPFCSWRHIQISNHPTSVSKNQLLPTIPIWCFEARIHTFWIRNWNSATSRVIIINLRLDIFVHGHLLDDTEEAQRPSHPVHQFSGSDLSAQCLPSSPVATPWKRRASPVAYIWQVTLSSGSLTHTKCNLRWADLGLLELRSSPWENIMERLSNQTFLWATKITMRKHEHAANFSPGKYLLAISLEATESFDFSSTDFVKLLSELVAWGYPSILI